MSNVKRKKIVLKVLKAYNTIWHPESTLVYKSRKERIVIGRLVNNELIELDNEALDLCEEWDMKPDESLLDDASQSDNDNTNKEPDEEGGDAAEDDGEEGGDAATEGDGEEGGGAATEDDGEEGGGAATEDDGEEGGGATEEEGGEELLSLMKKFHDSNLLIQTCLKDSSTAFEKIVKYHKKVKKESHDILCQKDTEYRELKVKYDAIKTKFDTMKSLFM